ncbi:MYCBP-associated protein family-domain-containing protein [Phlyctochytrium arcticum]|nr:MYCBP-associated protein family-domain-containing protein [Phlyctochytrium arcticum]
MATYQTPPHPSPHHYDGANRPYVLVAKPVPPDHMGEDKQYTQPEVRPVPVSLLQRKDYGPRRRNGRLLDHTVLGDALDFEELERLERGNTSVPDEQVQQESKEQHTGLSDDQKAVLEESQRQQQEERRRWLSRLHVFQRYLELRETHALRTWQRHSLEWSRIENHLARASQKTRSQLLMANLNAYRQKLEHKELVETAMRLLEEREMGFWKTGLRVGSELLGLVAPMPRGGPRQIERVYKDEAGKSPKPSVYQKEKESDLEFLISLFDPFANHAGTGFMELRGHSVLNPQMQSLVSDLVSKLDMQSRPTTSLSDSPSRCASPSTTPGPQTPLPEYTQGPQLSLPISRVSFSAILSSTHVSTISVYNTGTTAIMLEWVPLQAENSLGVRAVKDGVQRFYFRHTRGMVLPGEAFDFGISFKSCRPGIFSEKWKITTVPEITGDDLVVHLQGIAIEPDTHHAKRLDLEKQLKRRQATTAATEIIQHLLRAIKPRVTPTAREHHHHHHQPANGHEELDQEEFMKMNAGIVVFFNPKAFTRLRNLASEVFESQNSGRTWDGSIPSLYQAIERMPSFDTRSRSLRTLNECVTGMSRPQIRMVEPLPNVVAYDILASIADRIAETSEVLRKRQNLPVVRAAANFFEADVGGADPAVVEAVSTQPVSTTAETTAAARKTTPPTVQTADTEKTKKGVPAKETAKKSVATPAAAAATATAPPATSKGGKAGPKGKTAEIVAPGDLESAPRPMVLAKLTIKPKKPDPTRGWTTERRQAEQVYLKSFRTEVRAVVASAMDRLGLLLEDARD